ncbi:MAG: gamma-glutamyltransferase [Vicinamibacterales bacterium]
MKRAYRSGRNFPRRPRLQPEHACRLNASSRRRTRKRTAQDHRLEAHGSFGACEKFEWPHESDETTRVSIVDGNHNAASMTYTLEQGYGVIVVPGAGFLLNSKMEAATPPPV